VKVISASINNTMKVNVWLELERIVRELLIDN